MNLRILWVIFSLILSIAASGCNKSSGSGDLPHNSPTGGALARPERIEVIGKDMKGNDILKKTYETEDSQIIVTEIPCTVITGTVILTGTAVFNELTLVTPEKEHYTFNREDSKNYRQEQEKNIELQGRVEKRVVKDKKTGRTLHKNWIFPETTGR